MAKCAARFLKSAKLRENWSQKSRKCAFYCLPYYWTRYPKKIWPKTARNSPYFLPFLLGQKNVKKQIIISDNVLLLYLYLSSVLSLFLSRMKYLNPGFESVVKSYLARRLKLYLASLLQGYNNAQLFMYMFYFDAWLVCTYSATHPSKSYTDWLLAVTHPRSQHSQYKAMV